MPQGIPILLSVQSVFLPLLGSHIQGASSLNYTKRLPFSAYLSAGPCSYASCFLPKNLSFLNLIVFLLSWMSGPFLSCFLNS